MKKAFSLLCAAGALAALDARSEGFAGIAAGGARWPSDVCGSRGSCDRGDTAWSARVGYMFSPYIGIEARYVDLGRAKLTESTISGADIDARIGAKGAGVGAVAAFPFADRFRITGAAGVARMRTRYERPDVSLASGGEGGTAAVVGLSYSETKTRPYYGVGLDYAFAPNLSLGVEATRYRVGLAGTADVDTFMGGITYRF